MFSVRDLSSIDVFCVFLGIYLLSKLVRRKQKDPLPPGPKGYPLIGNIFDMPTKQEWAVFSKWGKQYGKMCSIRVFGQPIVILNSTELAKEMFEKKSSIYSDRPVMQFGGNLVGWKNTLVLLPYGDRLRRYRRLAHGIIGSHASIKQFTYIEELETHRFLRRVLENPNDLAKHVQHTAGAIIIRITHGYEVKRINDPFVELADKAMEQFSLAMAPGSHLVDVLPIRNLILLVAQNRAHACFAVRHVPDWFPGAGFKRTAKEWAATLAEMVDQPYNFVKRELATGTAQVSFTSSLLEGKDVDPEDEFDIKCSYASFQTVSSIYSFFLAMTLNPEVMKKAQAEIDSVVGSDRLPTLEDRQCLPYLDALTKEVFRWNVVAPIGEQITLSINQLSLKLISPNLGMFHRSIKDDVHDGYFIPKGSLVIANVRGILHDPQVYADPHKFDPERFIASDNKPAEPDPRNVCFGFGRR
ncbi:hypothetical protein C0995_009681 [Termitomyces sp. Mi166|nr:hypothetical protein C0995_009681 [Termitomyces sp. Mi166\